ncbi:hypothetical protein Trco_001567 [Trichoderma cornu-damae]|uniref:Uncharacterized protein n=1 Tax=Trichoderma cornu-damae TaxID=654480 RepID=A0A9P8QZF7_9HYPO|nr:hypothetical protein Trco_001567 [Trichoderma cornu-damae]
MTIAHRALGAGDLSLLSLDPGGRHADRHGQRLEGALGPVVVVVAPQAVDVQGDAGGLGEALQAVGDHLCAELAEELAPEAQVDDGVGPVGEVDDGSREGLVQGRIGIAEAGDAGRGAQGPGKGGADGDAAVLGGVVVVNYRIREVSHVRVGAISINRGALGQDALCRSPWQLSAMLQPACLASACSMWSRKPMPVLTEMTCDLLASEACAPVAASSRASASGGSWPPSMLRAIWIDVSLVSRARAAARIGAEGEAICFVCSQLDRGTGVVDAQGVFCLGERRDWLSLGLFQSNGSRGR